MSEPTNPDAVSLEQQLQYARDLRRIYDSERARRRELEEVNRALAAANAELDRRLYDLMAAQEWILAVNSSRELPALMDLLAEPLMLLLRAQETVVFPWDPEIRRLGSALGLGGRPETPLLGALRTSPLSTAVLTAGEPREIPDLAAERPTPPAQQGSQYSISHPLREGGVPGTAEPAPQPALSEVELPAPPFPGPPAPPFPPREGGLGGLGHLVAAQELGWRALVALPLVARGERVGLLYVAWSEPHQTDERERMLLDLVGQHAAVSLAKARLLEQVPFLCASVGCALRHHERFDGEGYPYGMLGDNIPIEARVVAIADTFDAMDRPAVPQGAAEQRGAGGDRALRGHPVRPGRGGRVTGSRAGQSGAAPRRRLSRPRGERASRQGAAALKPLDQAEPPLQPATLRPPVRRAGMAMGHAFDKYDYHKH